MIIYFYDDSTGVWLSRLDEDGAARMADLNPYVIYFFSFELEPGLY